MLDMSGKHRLINYFIENIERGNFRVGSKVKTTRELAREFNIALTTAHSALRQLEVNGYLLRQQGSGTFVQATHSGKASEKRKLSRRVCFIRFSGDSYKDLYGNLMFELKSRGADVDVVEYIYDRKEFLDQYDFSSCQTVIVSNQYASELLSAAFPDLHQIYLGDIPFHSFHGDLVSFHYYRAAYQAVEHLVKTGYKRIACYNISVSGRGKYRRLEADHITSGYESALKAFGLDYSYHAKYDPSHKGKEIIGQMLAFSERPEAVICTYDHRAVEIANYAQAADIRIPEDLALVSLGSSPLASEAKLSSVDFHPETMVAVCVNIIENLSEGLRAMPTHQHHYIETEMKIRESCGYRLKNP